jgi:hypothetical protein
MKQRITQTIRTTTSQIVWTGASIAGLGIAAALGIVAVNGLLDGWINSPTAYGLPTKIIYKATSANLYRAYILFYFVGAIIMLAVAIGNFCDVIIQQRRIREERKKAKNV